MHRILLAEDDDAIVRLLTDFLREEGFAVTAAAGERSAREALEYRLLLVFVNNRGKVLSRSRLLEEIWDVAGDFVNDNTLTVYIKRLREKIETDPAAPQIIRTVRGLGYRVEL